MLPYLVAYLATHPVRLRVGAWRGDDLPMEDVSFTSRDGLRLAGWFAPAQDAQGGVILCHGHSGNRAQCLSRARPLHAAGFHVLMFDFRAAGDSEGDLCTFGLHETQDLMAAADWLLARPEMRGLPLGAYGHSMGGAVSILTAAQDERICAVSTHGAFATLQSALNQRGKMVLGPFGKLFSKPVLRSGKRWFDFELDEVSPISAVSHLAPRPLLVTHGAKDLIIAPQDAQALYDAAGGIKHLNIFPRSHHIPIHPAEKDAYSIMLTDFFKTHLRL